MSLATIWAYFLKKRHRVTLLPSFFLSPSEEIAFFVFVLRDATIKMFSAIFFSIRAKIAFHLKI
jgi:hypothetical protein